jgi:hypothetical protein
VKPTGFRVKGLVSLHRKANWGFSEFLTFKNFLKSKLHTDAVRFDAHA